MMSDISDFLVLLICIAIGLFVLAAIIGLASFGLQQFMELIP